METERSGCRTGYLNKHFLVMEEVTETTLTCVVSSDSHKLKEQVRLRGPVLF